MFQTSFSLIIVLATVGKMESKYISQSIGQEFNSNFASRIIAETPKWKLLSPIYTPKTAVTLASQTKILRTRCRYQNLSKFLYIRPKWNTYSHLPEYGLQKIKMCKAVTSTPTPSTLPLTTTSPTKITPTIPPTIPSTLTPTILPRPSLPTKTTIPKNFGCRFHNLPKIWWKWSPFHDSKGLRHMMVCKHFAPISKTTIVITTTTKPTIKRTEDDFFSTEVIFDIYLYHVYLILKLKEPICIIMNIIFSSQSNLPSKIPSCLRWNFKRCGVKFFLQKSVYI